jgi:hypothetical protein
MTARGIVVPELQRFYGKAIVIIISDLNRSLSIITFVLYQSVYRVLFERQRLYNGTLP